MFQLVFVKSEKALLKVLRLCIITVKVECTKKVF